MLLNLPKAGCQAEDKALNREIAATKAVDNAKTAKLLLGNTREWAGEALEALKVQKEVKQRKKVKLERIASDKSNGVVSRNKAKTKLAILLYTKRMRIMGGSEYPDQQYGVLYCSPYCNIRTFCSGPVSQQPDTVRPPPSGRSDCRCCFRSPYFERRLQ